MRLQRRGLIDSYVKVTEMTKKGKQHLHVLFRGKYIAQAMLSEMWQEIHKAKVVDIRRAGQKWSNSQMAHEMAKYMSKDSAMRYSWSWAWVWRGFVKDWDMLKRRIRVLSELEDIDFMGTLLFAWHILVRNGRDAGWAKLERLGLPEL